MQQPIRTVYTGQAGVTYTFEYYEADSFDQLPRDRIAQVYAIAFYGDRFIVVNNIQKPGSYTPIGGRVEQGEQPEDTLHRELKEEANVAVRSYKPIGYQKVIPHDSDEGVFYQLRYAAKVEPFGPFEGDPDGKVTEVICADPAAYKQYFDWGEIGDRIMEQACARKSEL